MTTEVPQALPVAAGTYQLDPAHSGVHFQIRHLGLSTVRGIFRTFDATLEVGSHLGEVGVTATVDLASVDTDQADRDAHLRSTDFFHADEHPQMEFRSTSARSLGDDEYELEGDLTINRDHQAGHARRPVQRDAEPSDGRQAACRLRRDDRDPAR